MNLPGLNGGLHCEAKSFGGIWKHGGKGKLPVMHSRQTESHLAATGGIRKQPDLSRGNLQRHKKQQDGQRFEPCLCKIGRRV